MIKGVFIAFGIMVGCLFLLPIPLVHFVVLASPFIGGYVGISSARTDPRPQAAKSITFGFLLGGLILIISVPAAVAVTVLADLGRFFWVLWGGVLISAIYTASMSALGAMFSLNKADSKSQPSDTDANAG